MSNTFRGSTNSGNLLFTFFLIFFFFFISSFWCCSIHVHYCIQYFSFFSGYTFPSNGSLKHMAKNEASLASYYNKRSNKVSAHTFSISALYWAVCYTCVPLCLKWNSKEYKEYCLVQLLVKVKPISRDSSLKPINLLQSRRRGKV